MYFRIQRCPQFFILLAQADMANYTQVTKFITIKNQISRVAFREVKLEILFLKADSIFD